ncbi:uncharacterized protein N7459_002518 [Penicillium hispanicum]|uniref:uncharacterized protein n=1 Tax=Penicillium hispanicum TaxID=1080232 RepID=UPI00253FAD5A|nr:uncharacterized protein N7459_002518 [Penicillium hispanicum]KAJ5586753.1 hypothetical protein N7459_002518 [Penicillium hispanicum]
MQDIRLTTILVACLSVFPALTNAFWRLPCRGRTGLVQLDPIVDPGKISSHVHTVHGGGNFGMSSDMQTLRESNCTSCAVLQDKSAYWTPALYFMHKNGSAEVVPEVGGMLAYYLLYGENVTAFPNNFRMLAGDPFQRNFTWPIPDPPKSSWSGAQASQAALRQKALGFNCLNYAKTPEGSLQRHYMPNKTYLDRYCTDGLRLELMFPSCWNGKDVDSPDHKSHVAYPSLVMDGTCPEGYERRLVSLFYETIWNTYAFKDVDGYFTLANGDPTGFGYHGDFMFGWEDGVLQEAVDTCTSETGLVDDCKIFDIQTESDERQCSMDLPSPLRHEDVHMHADGLPGGMPIEWGPCIRRHAIIRYGLYDVGGPNTGTAYCNRDIWYSHSGLAFSVEPIEEEVVYIEQDIVVMINANGVPYATNTGTQRTMSTATKTITETSTAVSYVQRDSIPPELETRDHIADHVRRHARHRHHLHLEPGVV